MTGATTDAADLRALLLLKALPGIGDLRLTQLLADHGGPQAALAAAPAAFPQAAGSLASRRVVGRVDRALAVIEQLRIRVVTRFDACYPQRLVHLHDPPCVLFARGAYDLVDDVAIAVVGARRATDYGRDATRLLTAGLVREGYRIVSGLARGIDSVAHEAALDARGGTIAVIGSGVDVAYPPEHAALHERIAADGLLLSEFLPGEPPQAHNFPRRNRIIAALAEAVLVVEAGENSGTKITVDHALDLGRDIFAVPGPIGRGTSAGTHKLIKDGAVFTTEVSDIVEVLHARAGGAPSSPSSSRARLGRRVEAASSPRAATSDDGTARASAAPGTGTVRGRGDAAHPSDPAAEPVDDLPIEIERSGSTAHGRILRLLRGGACHVDEVATAVAVPSATVLAALLELELDGRVRQLPGMRFDLQSRR